MRTSANAGGDSAKSMEIISRRFHTRNRYVPRPYGCHASQSGCVRLSCRLCSGFSLHRSGHQRNLFSPPSRRSRLLTSRRRIQPGVEITCPFNISQPRWPGASRKIRRDGPDGVIIVCDDGVGMSHAPVDTGRKHLGMAIVRTLIEKDLQGTIDFDDGVPEGTVVTIRFPLPERGE